MRRSDFRAAADIGKCDALRPTPGKAFNDHAPWCYACNARITKARITGGSPCFTFAAAPRRSTSIALGLATIPDHGTHAVRPDAQLDILSADRCRRRHARNGHDERDTRGLNDLQHVSSLVSPLQHDCELDQISTIETDYAKRFREEPND
jgi:hypothetical protein